MSLAVVGVAAAGCGADTSTSTTPPVVRSGTYIGVTSQGLPIGFVVGPPGRLGDLRFGWRARCADGRMHTNTIALSGAAVRNGTFSIEQSLETGGIAAVKGRFDGATASGVLSRRKGSAFGTNCRATGIRWHARVRRGSGSPDGAV